MFKDIIVIFILYFSIKPFLSVYIIQNIDLRKFKIFFT